MPITIEPLGGLGNQLFIYALGRRLALDLGTELYCDTWNFHNYAWHVYELDTFATSIACVYSSRCREMVGHKTRGLVRRARALHLAPTPWSRLVLEQTSTFDPQILDSADGSRLNGYFQSWKYFEPIADQIRKEIVQVHQPSAWLSETRNALEKIGPWVAVHVRRGTYLEVPIMGIVRNDYYERAIGLLDDLVGELPLVLFSDSPEMLSDLSDRYLNRVVPVSTPQEVRAIDVLQVMSDAAHLVLGNSTFSWWAAFIKNRTDRYIIAPRPWLDDQQFNERDLLLPEWITVGRDEESSR